ncbi:farnesyl pyrophosphate synthase 1, mitochondrial [Arabidopsis lyrata subsp. lyrata]|uniref:farnesyl pyrophosphate synthase 1, mitochondrial n=1 Tax=Arabidopsis lyrata subsp. lyrata TaxID=81972 RepID=UPI000A29E989|nr:farnesyl pyrophosphate synthase 1, mitochondrial [Arabidopsis lyrata subsp. lyrata]|eukprot:XP_020880745.1 farnesyl pyrophosphate synthase 1, mitochondrial [Arabidopsis lyrata subsp. lyrata]
MKIPFSRAVCFSTQVACALIIAGENLKNHVDVKNVLVDIGIYFQVQENYGKSDQSNAAIVKDLFKELDLEEVFMEYGSKTYEKLKQVIEAHQSKTI